MLSEWTTYQVNPIAHHDRFHDQFEVSSIFVSPSHDVKSIQLHDETSILDWITSVMQRRPTLPEMQLTVTGIESIDMFWTASYVVSAYIARP